MIDPNLLQTPTSVFWKQRFKVCMSMHANVNDHMVGQFNPTNFVLHLASQPGIQVKYDLLRTTFFSQMFSCGATFNGLRNRGVFVKTVGIPSRKTLYLDGSKLSIKGYKSGVGYKSTDVRTKSPLIVFDDLMISETRVACRRKLIQPTTMRSRLPSTDMDSGRLRGGPGGPGPPPFENPKNVKEGPPF